MAESCFPSANLADYKMPVHKAAFLGSTLSFPDCCKDISEASLSIFPCCIADTEAAI